MATPQTSPRLRVDIWSDVVCPFCWIGKRRLEAAVKQLGMEGEVEVVFRAFELNPALKASKPLTEYLGAKFGGPAQAKAMTQHVARMGAPDGLTFDFDHAIAAPTFDAHRLTLLAQEHGLGRPVMERFMRAHFAEREDLADHGTLRRLAAEAGLDAAAVDRVLGSDAYAKEVREDQGLARAYGIQGVPFFLIDGKYGVSGAQPVEVLARGITLARDARGSTAALPPEAGASGDADACDVPR
ncbi:MAG TPA: DsbA family oxidoreductase [Candidatus Thermoplasmatota archaeon]|nr:DsbA family oxidoreductase [Candidatus Thermoplasmatota archaeon]